jgi:hypothetical protein
LAFLAEQAISTLFHNNGYSYTFKEVLQHINFLLAMIRYTYSNLRILDAHVSAEDSCKLFRITIKVVQVLEFNEFRHIHGKANQKITVPIL